MTRRRLLGIAVGAGAAGALCWLPTGLAPLMPLAMWVALRGLRGVTSGRDAVIFGLAFGAARYAFAGHPIVYLTSFSPLAVILYVLAIAYVVPFSVLEAWGAYRLERFSGLPRGVGYGLIFAILEKVRTLTDLAFPADLVSHGFGTHPQWLLVGSYAGPFAVTLLVFGVAYLIDLAIVRRRWSLALVAAAVWLLFPLIDAMRPAAPRAELRVGIVQPSTSLAVKLDRDAWPALWRQLEGLSRSVAPDGDLIVWPETARPGPIVWKEAEGAFSDPRMERLSVELGVPILYGSGIARMDEHGQVRALYNGAALVFPDGRPSQWYAKQRLLPFIEGLPFAEQLGFDPAERHAEGESWFRLHLFGNFHPGKQPVIFEMDGARIGVLICYEGFYPQLVRRYARDGANVLAVLTNDAWWGRSVFARWHATMISARARETGLPVVRAANSGVSSSTDSQGRMGSETTGLFEVTTLTVDVPAVGSSRTPYTAGGDWIVGLAAIILGAAIVTGVRRRRSRPAS